MARTTFVFIALVLMASSLRAAAPDSALGRLIQKLPPPEKFVDPAINDPLTKKMQAALKARNYGTALELSRQIARRYPRSLGAQMTHALLAASFKQAPEARAGFKTVLGLRGDFVPAYVGLGLVEASQNRFSPALEDFRQVTQIAPKLDAGWIGCSLCAERLGRRNDSLNYARKATAVAPNSAGAWSQLARAEGLAGNKKAGGAALARANQLVRQVRKR